MMYVYGSDYDGMHIYRATFIKPNLFFSDMGHY